MASSKLSAEDRLLRKRQAARLRQQRCRARKRQAIQLKQMHDKVQRVKPNAGHATVTANENQHPNNHRIAFDNSPRSVYWQQKDAPCHRYPAPPAQQRFPVFEAKRTYSYDGPATMETRYDSNTVEYHPVYSRYQPSPPMQPQVQPRFVPSLQALPRRYPLPYHHAEHAYMQAVVKPKFQQPWAPPMQRVVAKPAAKPVVKKEAPVKSKEAAAIDALFSLKNTDSVTPPPTIQRVAPPQKPSPYGDARLYRGPVYV